MVGILHFAFMGFLGGVVYALRWAKSYSDLKSYKVFQHIVIGTIIGYFYYYLHVEHGFPDSIGAAIAGYAGSDFIEFLVEKFGYKKPTS